VCDRVALLRKGELVLFSTVDEIKKVAARNVRVTFVEDQKQPDGLPAGCNIIESDGRSWGLRVEGPLGPFVKWLAALPVKDLEVEEARLEDVLIKYYQGSPS